MDAPAPTTLKPPIGILASLAAGFDRVAGHPELVLPPLVLDLLLWFAPQVRATSLINGLTDAVAVPGGLDPALAEQLTVIQQGFADLASRFNILSALSAIPVGVPSLMAARMPVANPLGLPPAVQTGDLLTALGAWALFTLIGVGMGAVFHLLVARRVAPKGETAPLARAWGRFTALTGAMYAGLLVLMAGAAAVVSAAMLLLPLLGAGLMFILFSLAFWLTIYLAFTPHGIIRYRFGLWKAMRESMRVVRWNMPYSVAFVALTMIVTYAASWVWAMAAEDSWFSILAVIGHAFVSAMLIAASYVFYQGRHEWMVAMRRAYLAKAAAAGLPVPRGEE